MPSLTSDFVIIGGGVIGLCMARELHQRFPGQRITVIEKEPKVGLHASGRNSGVLHAGFYYTKDSLKAKFTREGNRLVKEFCAEHDIPVNACGKLVVARNDHEVEQLHELNRRAIANGVEVSLISEQEAKAIEPRVKTQGLALLSPTTATIEPGRVMAAMSEQLKQDGIDILVGSGYQKPTAPGTIQLQDGRHISYGYLINAAGLYADKVAKDFGFAEHLTILPFKGLYLYSSEPVGAFNTNIYPVPDLNNPFLGVHVTLAASGIVKIGPTAIPAFWRENYSGLSNFRLQECYSILATELGLMLDNRFNLLRLGIQEFQKYYKPLMVKFADSLAHGIRQEHYKKWGPAGIRAQLVNLKTRGLEMDFVHQGDNRSFHVLNSVSPAFTCSLPFSSYLVDQIQELTA